MASQNGESAPRRIARHFGQRFLLGKTLRESPAAIVHIHTCSGFSFHRSAWDLRVARRHGCQTVLHMHGAQFDDYFSKASGLEQRFIRLTLLAADRVVALSDGWREKIRSMAPGAKLTVIENAVEGSSAGVSRPARSQCRFLVLCRMDAWKGIDDVLDACAILKRQGTSFGLTLAGPAGTAGDPCCIRGKIANRGLTDCAVYVGPVEGEAKARLFAESDALVQPSHQEGMPITILEAFANDLPVIASRVGSIPEIMVHEEHGLLIPAKNPAALACAMGALAVDPPQRTSMGRAGGLLARTRFSLTRCRDDLLELYDGLLREKPARAGSGPIRRATLSTR